MAEKVRVEVADLQHGLQVVPVAAVAGSDDVEVRRDANVLVLTAGHGCEMCVCVSYWRDRLRPSAGGVCTA